MWLPDEVRWLLAAGAAAVAGLVLVSPDAVALGYGAALLGVLATTGVVSATSRPRWVRPGFVVVVAGLAALGAARWGGSGALVAALLPSQVAAALASSSRRSALAGAAAVGGAAIGAAWFVGALGFWAVTPVVGVAVAGVVSRLLDVVARLELRAAAPASTHDSEARLRLEHAQRDLADATRELHREAKQRRQAEAQALAALKTRTSFLSVMSHELRTPLNQIIGFSELLLEELSDGAAGDIAGDVQRIHFASQNLLEMITNVLDLAKIEAGTMAVSVEDVDVAELVENVVQSFAMQAHQRNNVIRVRCPNDLPRLHSDRTKLRTVLANLLSNACKFTRAGTIRVAVSVSGQGASSLIVEISDTGIGIVPEQIDHLFAAFVQIDGSTTRRHDGSGLGLALAHHFCALLGGEITVESTPGVGSLFRVRVPREFVDPRRAGHVLTSMATSALH